MTSLLLLNIVEEQGIVNMIMDITTEMEVIEAEEYEEFLFNISLIDYTVKPMTLKVLKTFLNKSNKYFKIKGYKSMRKQKLVDTLISRTKELLE